MDKDKVSGLSLFLYSRALVVMAVDESEQVIAVNLYTFQDNQDLKQIVQEDTLINSPNTYGKLYIHNGAFVLVPHSLFDPSHCEVYLNFHTEIDPVKMEMFYEGVQGGSIQVVGCADKTFLAALDTALPDLDVSSGAVACLSFLSENFIPSNDEELVLFPGPGSLYAAAYKAGELILFNHFQILSENDLMKYLFSLTKTLGFDQRDMYVRVVGDLSHGFSSEEQLQPFFNHLQPLHGPETSRFVPGASDFKNSGLLEAFWTS